MQALRFSALDMPDLHKRIGMISTAFSDIFASCWRVGAVDGDTQASIDLSTADGVALSHATMSAMALDNRSTSSKRDIKFCAFITNQPQLLRLGTGEAMRLHPRELLIVRSDRPCKFMTTRAYTTTSLVIDADLFEEYVPEHERVVGRRLRFPFGFQDLLASTLESCVAMSEAGRFEEAGPRITRSFLELLAVLAREGRGNEKVRQSTGFDIRQAQVKSFIDKHFQDPGLSISAIARQLHLTPRYIQLAFEKDDQTPSEYLRKCRIEACARQLLDKTTRTKSITEICFANGFNSSSHFSTEFKRVFGMTPRDWRLSGGRHHPDFGVTLDC